MDTDTIDLTVDDDIEELLSCPLDPGLQALLDSVFVDNYYDPMDTDTARTDTDTDETSDTTTASSSNDARAR